LAKVLKVPNFDDPGWPSFSPLSFAVCRRQNVGLQVQRRDRFIRREGAYHILIAT
jgi:hypothetical protein